MGDVIHANFSTTLDVPVENVLANCTGLDQVIVIGLKGDEAYYASSQADIASTLLQVELFKQFLLDQVRG